MQPSQIEIAVRNALGRPGRTFVTAISKWDDPARFAPGAIIRARIGNKSLTEDTRPMIMVLSRPAADQELCRRMGAVGRSHTEEHRADCLVVRRQLVVQQRI